MVGRHAHPGRLAPGSRPWGSSPSALTALALSYGFYRYQRWEAARVIEDWSFLQWGEFVTGAFIGAGVAVFAPLVINRL